MGALYSQTWKEDDDADVCDDCRGGGRHGCGEHRCVAKACYKLKTLGYTVCGGKAGYWPGGPSLIK